MLLALGGSRDPWGQDPPGARSAGGMGDIGAATCPPWGSYSFKQVLATTPAPRCRALPPQ